MWLDERSERGLSPHQQPPQSMHKGAVENCQMHKIADNPAKAGCYLTDSNRFATCLSKSPFFFRRSSTFLIEWITDE